MTDSVTLHTAHSRNTLPQPNAVNHCHCCKPPPPKSINLTTHTLSDNPDSLYQKAFHLACPTKSTSCFLSTLQRGVVSLPLSPSPSRPKNERKKKKKKKWRAATRSLKTWWHSFFSRGKGTLVLQSDTVPLLFGMKERFSFVWTRKTSYGALALALTLRRSLATLTVLGIQLWLIHLGLVLDTQHCQLENLLNGPSLSKSRYCLFARESIVIAREKASSSRFKLFLVQPTKIGKLHFVLNPDQRRDKGTIHQRCYSAGQEEDIIKVELLGNFVSFRLVLSNRRRQSQLESVNRHVFVLIEAGM